MMHLERIEARCIPENLPSSRVMEKAGMSYEGTLRDHLHVKGEFRTLNVYSISRKEWEA
jgi:ribosomal-protein-alanine N-acetyltransferase